MRTSMYSSAAERLRLAECQLDPELFPEQRRLRSHPVQVRLSGRPQQQEPSWHKRFSDLPRRANRCLVEWKEIQNCHHWISLRRTYEPLLLDSQIENPANDRNKEPANRCDGHCRWPGPRRDRTHSFRHLLPTSFLELQSLNSQRPGLSWRGSAQSPRGDTSTAFRGQSGCSSGRAKYSRDG